MFFARFVMCVLMLVNRETRNGGGGSFVSMLAMSWAFFLPTMMLADAIDYATWTIGQPHFQPSGGNNAKAFQAFVFFAPGFLPVFYLLFLSKWARASQHRFNERYLEQIRQRQETSKWMAFPMVMLLVVGPCWNARLHPVASVLASFGGILIASWLTRWWLNATAIPTRDSD